MARDRTLREEWIVDFSKRFVSEHQDQRSEHLLAALLHNGLCDERRVRDYLIMSDYTTMLPTTGSVMDTMYQLADKYQLSDRQVQNVIYGWRKSKKEGK